VQPDPKWLELLKLSGSKFLAITLGCFIIIVLQRNNFIELDKINYQFVLIICIISASLSAVSIIESIGKSLQRPLAYLRSWWFRRAHAKEFERYIPFLTDREIQIFAYMLHYNKKSFTNTQDCGYANILLAKGYVKIIARPGQMVDYFDVPFGVPDHIWNVLEKHRDKFPHTPKPQSGYGRRRDGDGVEAYPWRTPSI
jgi:hypothetical protein